jgi:exopolysaccharide biosynthesis polyprenyl glycosylphosphotransferase
MAMRQKKNTGNNIKKHFDFIIIDFVILEFSYFFAVLWYHNVYGKELDFGNVFRQQCLILFVCLIASVTLAQPYKNILKRDKWQEISATIKHTIYMAVMDILLMYMMKDFSSTSRLTFAATWTFYVMLETMFRLWWKRRIRSYILKHVGSRKQIIVLTKKDNLSKIASNLDVYLFRDFDVRGVFLTDYDRNIDFGMVVNHSKVLGSADDMIDYAVHNWVDEAVLDIPNNGELSKRMEELFSTMGIIIHYTVALFGDLDNLTSSTSYVERMGNYIVLTHKNRDVSSAQMTLKRVIDIIGGLVGSFIAIIIMIIVGPIIKTKSPGPIIFVQERVGKNGKVFKMYKIRSMYMDAEERKAELLSQNKMDGFMFKMNDDPRIIGSEKKGKNGEPKGIGNFIRKTSLDEFPQFFNVLKGDMSLVGTRPPTIDEWNKYSSQHRKRLSIKPGITGLWQISGRSNITNFDEVVRLDSEYIDNWTFGMDMKILVKTLEKVFKKDGAE